MGRVSEEVVLVILFLIFVYVDIVDRFNKVGV